MTDVVVIGAGQAGLSASYFLRKRDVDHVVLDANPSPGGAWLHRWPSLRMRTVHGIHELPGMPFEQPAPEERANEAIPSYFARYEQLFDLPVVRPVNVTQVVDKLEQRGLVRRERLEGDRRCILVHLTPAGEALIALPPIAPVSLAATAVRPKRKLRCKRRCTGWPLIKATTGVGIQTNLALARKTRSWATIVKARARRPTPA